MVIITRQYVCVVSKQIKNQMFLQIMSDNRFYFNMVIITRQYVRVVSKQIKNQMFLQIMSDNRLKPNLIDIFCSGFV